MGRKTYLAPLAFVLMVGFLAVSGTASAQDLDPGRYDPTLSGLQFGWTRDQVVDFLKKRVQERYSVLIRGTMDVRDQHRLRGDEAKEKDAIGSLFVEFDGTQTGWNVSVIRDEFEQGRGEAMLQLREGKTHHYFFFTNGQFYKLMISIPKDERETVMAAVEAAYGKSTQAEYEYPRKQEGLKALIWKFGSRTFRFDDRTQSFQSVTLRWADPVLDDAVQKAWSRQKTEDEGINPLIRDAIHGGRPDGEGYDESDDPVDAMIGSKPSSGMTESFGKTKAKKGKPRKK
jgi:hypothetical protein